MVLEGQCPILTSYLFPLPIFVEVFVPLIHDVRSTYISLRIKDLDSTSLRQAKSLRNINVFFFSFGLLRQYTSRPVIPSTAHTPVSLYST